MRGLQRVCLGEVHRQWLLQLTLGHRWNEPNGAKHILADMDREFSVTNSVKLDCRRKLTPWVQRFPWEGSRENEEGNNKKNTVSLHNEKSELLIPKRNCFELKRTRLPWRYLEDFFKIYWVEMETWDRWHHLWVLKEHFLYIWVIVCKFQLLLY